MRCFQVDAFTGEAFGGNPAAVCVLEDDREAAWMQSVAAEMNLSETAFVRKTDHDVWNLRWFTPTDEVDLCGHATLATAHVLWTEGITGGYRLRFATKSGELCAEQSREGVRLDFPAERCSSSELPGSAEVLGVEPIAVLKNRMDLLVVVRQGSVKSIEPDISAIAEWPYRGVIVTSRSTERYDFISRFFAPRVGVPEDPVTGSAHCALIPYWSDQLSKHKVVGYQASERGGVVRGYADDGRVILEGSAVTVMRGELVV